jgi:hypothetical protein
VIRFLRTLVCIAAMGSALAHAHKPSDSYLMLDTGPGRARLTGQWDIALRDLEHAVGLDLDGDGAITWGELRAREASIEQYAAAHLFIDRVDKAERGACPLAFGGLLTDEHVDGAYAVLSFSAACTAPPPALAIRYSLLFDSDPNHRGLLNLRTANGSQAIVFSQAASAITTAVTGSKDRSQALKSFVKEGISHILQGYDHLLFLITLLLPAVLLFRNGSWLPCVSLHDAILDVTKIVTAFTIAHSCTLSIAALGWIHLPSRFVEAAIASTVVLGALNNLRPIVTRRRWLAAFVFGLIHGFGFASVLADLGLQGADLGFALLGFNMGVELGQLAVVFVLVPLVYLTRTSHFYRRVFIPGGAVLIAAMAGYWFVERAFELTIY